MKLGEVEAAAAKRCMREYLLTDGTEISGGDHHSSIEGVFSFGLVGR